MISSVMKNFSTVRNAVRDTIIASENNPVMAEYTISDQPPVNTINELVEKSECYIGIFHERWGWIPSKDNPENLSVTALEFTLAKKKGIPMAVFVSNLEKDSELQQFIEKIGEHYTGEWLHKYNSPEHLLGLIGLKIPKLIERISNIPKDFERIKNELVDYNNRLTSIIKDHVHSIYEPPKEFEKIEKVISENNIWLIGQRGIGKSVILKKIIEKQIENKKNVLFLRSEDILREKNFQNVIKNEINLTINELISKFTEKEESLLMIIDSVEAIPRNPDVWQTFSADILQILQNPKIRIIFSIRKSDYLAFKENFSADWGSEIYLDGLKDEQIERILSAIGIRDKIDKTLFPILKQPFYLEILDTLTREKKTDEFSSLSTQSQFLKMHYNQIVRNSTKWSQIASERVTLIFSIAEDMFNTKRFKLPNFRFVSPAFDSLRTDGIIIDDGNSIQFFHQVYFDFIMSMKIIESEEIANYLKQVGNEPFLRSTIQFTLSLLRDDDFESYLKNIQEILNSKNVDEYWKRDTIGFIGQLNNLKDGEEKIIQDVLTDSPDLQKYFFDSILENQNPFWYSLWKDSVFATWAADSDFKHSDLLTNYISKSYGWLNGRE